MLFGPPLPAAAGPSAVAREERAVPLTKMAAAGREP